MSEKNELVITRTFNAPRELVWKAWTEPEHLKKWIGPKGYTSPDYTMDFRVGGRYHSSMMDEKGNKIWAAGTYTEIIPMEKIVCTDSFADENGNAVLSDHYGMPGMPKQMTITVLLEEDNGKTKVTVIHSGMPAGEMQQGATMGWNSSLDKLAGLLAVMS